MMQNKVDFTKFVLDKPSVPYHSDKCIHMHISMPCPLKVPFRQLFTRVVEHYNAHHPEALLHCPDITDCSSPDIEEIFRTATDESSLPDILVTSNFRMLLAHGFYDRFIQNHIYQGVVNPTYEGHLSSMVVDHLLSCNIGVWSFSSWSFVQDLTVEQPSMPIDSWQQILSEEMHGKITVHGHLDKPTFSLAYFLRKKFGDEGLKRYAQNIGDLKHFSQAIKRLNSTDPHKTLLTMLPDVAISKIPSGKQIKVLNLKEAKIVSPMVMMVKRSKLETCQEILNVLWSEPFESLLERAGGILPHQLKSDKAYFVPDFNEIAHTFEQEEAEINKIYNQNLHWAEIESKLTQGGTCK